MFFRDSPTLWQLFFATMNYKDVKKLLQRSGLFDKLPQAYVAYVWRRVFGSDPSISFYSRANVPHTSTSRCHSSQRHSHQYVQSHASKTRKGKMRGKTEAVPIADGDISLFTKFLRAF